MKITNVSYSVKNKWHRLSSEIILKNGKKHYVFFEIEDEFGDFIAKDASPFLPIALLASMKKKEDLLINDSVSKKLCGSIPDIMKIVQNWSLGFEPITVKPDLVKGDPERPKGVSCFFSAGVDSFYTYFKNKEKIHYLIFVQGFDIDINNVALYKKIEGNIIKIAKSENKRLIRIRTNVRKISEQYFDWDFFHGFAIACVALFLRKGLREIYASCGLPNKNTDHHFMTPELDLLWSSENSKINHFGCSADKLDKLKFISDSQVAMDNLRVCWMNTNRVYNCCACEKCFRNMLGLYLADSLWRCKTFDKGLDLQKLRNTRVNEYCLKYFTAILKRLKLKNDNSEVRRALEEFILNNKSPKLHQRVYRNTRDFVRFFDNKYNANRLYWFLAQRGFIR